MALVQCRECQKQVSTWGYTCPSCGCPTKRGIPSLFLIGIILGLVGLAAAKYLVGWPTG